MTTEDTTPARGARTRRARRERAGSPDGAGPGALPFGDRSDAPVDTADDAADAAATADPGTDSDLEEQLRALEIEDPDDDADPDAETPAEWADSERPATALAWLDTSDVVESTHPADLNAVTMADGGPGLLTDMTRRSVLRGAPWLPPVGTLVGLVLAYAIAMLAWPLHAVPPTVAAVEFTTTPSTAAEISWPVTGSAGVGIEGVSSASSTADAASIASITKVVTTLMVLDRMPLQLGEQGPEFAFTYGDSIDYWDYRRGDQSALDVPVDGVLTEYQMLQGILLGSANNYTDRLARELWGSDDEFRGAATAWLAERGLSDITIVTPSGFDEGNVATPDALLRLGERAMQNPVFAEIVGTAAVELPGAGLVENTNGMLTDPGVTGIKTGTLEGWSLLTSKDVTVGDTTVQLFASVLNQGDDEERLAVTRSLFSQVESALQAIVPAVPAGTVVGEVSTVWGGRIEIVSSEDASVVLWNGASATASTDFALGDDDRADGDAVGTLTVNGPVDAVTVDAVLADEIAGPSPWWRLTHPFELLGIAATK